MRIAVEKAQSDNRLREDATASQEGTKAQRPRQGVVNTELAPQGGGTRVVVEVCDRGDRPAQESGVRSQISNFKFPVSSFKTAFTLIEMLVVIAIIGILAGIVFKMMSMAGRKGETAECVELLEKIANALEEYRAEYGHYPPVLPYPAPNDAVAPGGQPVFYEIPIADSMTPWLRGDSDKGTGHIPQNDDSPVLLFWYGLVAYLWPREGGPLAFAPSGTDSNGIPYSFTNLHQWVPDTERDLAAKKRWWHFIEDIPLINVDTPMDSVGAYYRDGKYQGLGVASPYANNQWSIVDPWGDPPTSGTIANDHQLCYESRPPHLTYRLWSKGPKLDDPSDDIHRDSWDE